jgi:hypothetical protein
MKNLYFTLIFGCFTIVTAMTADAQSGTTGNLTWRFSNDTLTISGTVQ